MTKASLKEMFTSLNKGKSLSPSSVSHYVKKLKGVSKTKVRNEKSARVRQKKTDPSFVKDFHEVLEDVVKKYKIPSDLM